MQRKTRMFALTAAAALLAGSAHAQNLLVIPAPEQNQPRLTQQFQTQAQPQQFQRQAQPQGQFVLVPPQQQQLMAEAQPQQEGTLFVVLNPQEVRQAQQKLREYGFSQEPADARWDMPERQALMRFQESRNLQPTGEMDLPTLVALGIQPQPMQQQAAYLSVDPALAQEIEQRFVEQGYVDPLTGGVSHRAVAAFQQAQNIEPTGVLDAQTLAALDLISARKAQALAQQQMQMQQQPQVQMQVVPPQQQLAQQPPQAQQQPGQQQQQVAQQEVAQQEQQAQANQPQGSQPGQGQEVEQATAE